MNEPNSELESLRVDYRKLAAELSLLRGIAAERDHHRRTAESLTSRQHRQRAEMERLRAERDQARAELDRDVITDQEYREVLEAIRDALDVSTERIDPFGVTSHADRRAAYLLGVLDAALEHGIPTKHVVASIRKLAAQDRTEAE